MLVFKKEQKPYIGDCLNLTLHMRIFKILIRKEFSYQA